MNRKELADYILKSLSNNKDAIIKQWQTSGPIHHFVVDNVLPIEIAINIRNAFPEENSMRVRNNIREMKYVASQMDNYEPILEEILYAFQDHRVVSQIEKITSLNALEPDQFLYAGGISMMTKNHFLNPHLDNSHDMDRERYRVLNLLYYVSENWKLKDGGNLELWPMGTKEPQITVESNFNRLVVMITNTKSWHSVSSVNADRPRCCISNYYFSKSSVENMDYFHVTTFRGRPEQLVRDTILRIDYFVRNSLRRLFPKGLIKSEHFYKKK